MNNPYSTSATGATGAQNAGGETHPLSVILSARGNDQPPSDLEHALRAHCNKMLTKPQHSLSGAHLLLTVEKIAIRAYYPFDLARIRDDGGTGDDFDGLSKFLRSFKRSLVMFVLPQNDPVFVQQLDDTNSYFHRAQRLVGDFAMKNADKTIQVLLFPDTVMAVAGLLGFVKCFTPEVLARKKQHFLGKQEEYLIPLPPQDKAQDDRMQAIAGRRTADVVQKHCRKAGLPIAEDKQLINTFQTLEGLVRADRATLNQLPLEKRSIGFLLSFFGSEDPMQGMNKVAGAEFQRELQPLPMEDQLPSETGFSPNYPNAMMDDAFAVPEEPLAPTPARYDQPMIQTPHARYPLQQRVFPGWSGSVAASSYQAPQQLPPNHYSQPAGRQRTHQAPPPSTPGYSTRRSYPTAPRLLQFTPPPGSQQQQAPSSSRLARGSVYVPRSQRPEAGGNGRGIPRFQHEVPPSTARRQLSQYSRYGRYRDY